jgi:glycosyltransferase 2 family protein
MSADYEPASDPITTRSLVRWTFGALIVLFVVASVGATIVTTWAKLPDFDWRFNTGWVVLSVAGFTVLNLGHALLWRRLLHRLGSPIPLGSGLAIWCASGLARYTPGTVLYSMLRVTMAQSENVTRRTGLAGVVYEMAVMLTATVIVGGYALVQGDPLGVGTARWAILAIPAVAIASLHPAIFRPLADAALRKVGRPALPSVLPLGTLLQFVGLYCLSWIWAGWSLYALMEGLHPVHPDDVLIVIAAPAVGFIAAAVGFMIPGGLGARETGLAAVLSLAVPVAVAVAIAVAVRLVQLAIELLCAAGTSLAASRTRRAQARLTA